MSKLDVLLKEARLNHGVKFQPYQQEAIEKSKKNDGNLVVYHQVGSGKTPTSVGIFENLRESGANRAMVLVPSQLKDNYLYSGVHKFTDSSGVIIGSSSEASKPNTVRPENIPSDKNYYILSNEMFRANPNLYINKIKPDTIIVDEIHRYRDPESLNYKSLMKVRPKVDHFIGLTGTLLSNHPRDVLPVLDLVSNKTHSLGKYNDFDKNFTEIVKKKVGPLRFLGIGRTESNSQLKNTDLLKTELDKYVHTYKKDPPNTPEKKLTEVPVAMNKEQKQLYDYYFNKVPKNVRQKIKQNIPVSNQEATNILTKIIRVRQLSNSLKQFDKNQTLETASYATPKTNELLNKVQEHLKQNPKNKAIIYTNFYNSGVDVLDAGLKERNIPHGIYAGNTYTPKKVRDSAISDYLSGRIHSIVLNSAGVEGLNLPGTTAHYQLDPHYNPAVNEQAEARGIRAGSPVKKVDVNRFISVSPKTISERLVGVPLFGKENTVDQWISSIAKDKEALNKQVLSLLQKDNKNK